MVKLSDIGIIVHITQRQRLGQRQRQRRRQRQKQRHRQRVPDHLTGRQASHCPGDHWAGYWTTKPVSWMTSSVFTNIIINIFALGQFEIFWGKKPTLNLGSSLAISPCRTSGISSSSSESVGDAGKAGKEISWPTTAFKGGTKVRESQWLSWGPWGWQVGNHS